jgi:hypothetical protein
VCVCVCASASYNQGHITLRANNDQLHPTDPRPSNPRPPCVLVRVCVRDIARMRALWAWVERSLELSLGFPEHMHRGRHRTKPILHNSMSQPELNMRKETQHHDHDTQLETSRSTTSAKALTGDRTTRKSEAVAALA